VSEGVIVGDDDFGPLDVTEHVYRNEFAVAVITVGIIGQKHTQSILDGDAGRDDEESASELAAAGVAQTALTVCHAISIAMTVVLPAPVASFNATRTSSGFEDLTEMPLVDRKARLEKLLAAGPSSLVYNDHQIGRGPAFHRLACERGLEGIVSKRINGRYEPDRRSWLKTKCLNREEFVVVGRSDPEGSRHRVGSLLLGYYTPDEKLIYAGRVGIAELERVWHRLQPLSID
jgi:hypothetical protein